MTSSETAAVGGQIAFKRGDCRSCLATGWQLLLNSAFIGDGYRRERCHICGGSRKSDYRPDAADIRWQREARIRDAAIRNAPKGLDYVELGRLANAALASAEATNAR